MVLFIFLSGVLFPFSKNKVMELTVKKERKVVPRGVKSKYTPRCLIHGPGVTHIQIHFLFFSPHLSLPCVRSQSWVFCIQLYGTRSVHRDMVWDRSMFWLLLSNVKPITSYYLVYTLNDSNFIVVLKVYFYRFFIDLYTHAM